METPRVLLLAAAAIAVAVAPSVLALGRTAGAQEPAAADAGVREPREPAVVFLLRHAETAEDTRSAADPALSEGGAGRARRLAELLADAGVDRLFASEYRRTQDTLRPLANALGREIEIVPAREAERQLEFLRAMPPGSVAVVAGHSNTIPALARALGGTTFDIPHDAYDRLILLTLPRAEGSAPMTLPLRN